MTLPQTRPEALELRDLLEANLEALRVLHAEHLKTINLSLRAIDPAEIDLRADLRALASSHAPWIQAMSETRALLFVALCELIVGANGAELSMQLPQQAVNATA
ncbi:MAG TPA: hypothetical protein VH165_25215 [Kofleriaceae bacterium]|nr:hypothetical protein [Kofleriaceae bacterium]